MSIYVLTEYIEECKIKGIEPTWQGLHKWKKGNVERVIDFKIIQMYKKYD